jgi:L-iditol 2-dehydrogenase
MLVYGAGALGFLWASVASRRGLEVVVASRRPERAALAQRYGARFVDLSRETPPATDTAVDCTGQSTVWERLAELVRPGGQVLLFGGCAPGARVGFDAARLHYGELSLVGAFHYTPDDARAALTALAAGEVDPRPLIAERGTFEDLPRFLDAQARGEGVRYAIAVRS